MTTAREGTASLKEIGRAFLDAPKTVFVLCLLAYGLSQLDYALFAYAVPSIRKDLDISLQTMGIVTGVSQAIGGPLLVVFAHLIDRFGRKTMLQWGTVGGSLVIASISIVPNAAALAVTRGIGNALSGISYPATGAMVTETAPPRIRGIMAGLLQTGYPIGWFAAAMFAAPLLTHFGWRTLFLVALLWVPYVFVIRRYLKEPERFAEAKRTGKANLTMGQALQELFSRKHLPRTLTLFGAQFMFVIAYGGTSIFFPTYFVESRGIQIGSSAYLVGIGNAVGVLGYILAAVVGEAFLTRRTTVVVWTVLGALTLLLLVWGTETYWQAIAAFALMTMFFSGTAAVKFAYIAEVFPTHLRATGLAVCGSLAVNAGNALGPILITAAVARVGWNMAYTLVGAIPLIVTGLLYLLLKPIPSGLDVDEAARRA